MDKIFKVFGFAAIFAAVLALFSCEQSSGGVPVTGPFDSYTLGDTGAPGAAHPGSDWMKDLPDSRKICTLSLPGSHDSSTYNIGGISDIFAKSQALDLWEQLDAGVRVFDFRPGVLCLNDDLDIYHGIISTGETLQGELRTLARFLENHPKEFIIAITNIENVKFVPFVHKSKDKIPAKIVDILDRHPYCQWKPDLTVGEARGKLLYLSRDDLPTTEYAAFTDGWGERKFGDGRGYASWKYKDKNATMLVQDVDNPSDAQDKQVALGQCALYFSGTPESYNNWCFNCASGYVGDLNYATNAENVNKWFAEFIENHCTGPIGCCLMDFAGCCTYTRGFTTYNVCGDRLTKALIDHNFQ